MIAGLTNLAINAPAYIPQLTMAGFEPTHKEKAVIGGISVAAMWVSRSLLPSKSGLPGQQTDPPMANTSPQ